MTDARPVHRGEPTGSYGLVGSGRPIPGMNTEASNGCQQVRSDGAACKAKAGDDGLCVGHRRQARARG